MTQIWLRKVLPPPPPWKAIYLDLPERVRTTLPNGRVETFLALPQPFLRAVANSGRSIPTGVPNTLINLTTFRPVWYSVLEQLQVLGLPRVQRLSP